VTVTVTFAPLVWLVMIARLNLLRIAVCFLSAYKRTPFDRVQKYGFFWENGT
jgi:hypothetical protein